MQRQETEQEEATFAVPINRHLTVREPDSNPQLPLLATCFLNLNFLTPNIEGIMSFPGGGGIKQIIQDYNVYEFLAPLLGFAQRHPIIENNGNYKRIKIHAYLYRGTQPHTSQLSKRNRMMAMNKRDVYHEEPQSRKALTPFINFM